MQFLQSCSYPTSVATPAAPCQALLPMHIPQTGWAGSVLWLLGWELSRPRSWSLDWGGGLDLGAAPIASCGGRTPSASP